VRVRVFQAAAVAVLSILAIAVSAAQAPAPGAPYTVIAKTGRQPLAVRVVSGQEMFALDDLARLFGLTVREDALAGGITVSVNNQTIVMTPQQPLASIAGRMISLPAAPVREGRTWLVPVDFVARALAPIAGQRVELRKPSRLLLVGDVRMPRVAARSEALGAMTRVTIDVAPATPHSVTQDGQRLLLRFEADALDIGDIRVTPTDALQAVHAGDAANLLALDLGPRFASYRVADQPPPAPGAGRIFIELFAQTETATPPAGGATTQPAVPPSQETPPLLDLAPPGGLRTIVIDPGHGGDDPGVKGSAGTQEKTITLAIARRLKSALESRLGVRVLLTRDADQTVAIDQRAALANNNKADLFLSLHANASFRAGVSGAEVYFLSAEGLTEDAQRAARETPEALPVLGGGSRDIEMIPWEMAQVRYLDRSASLSQALEAALRDRVPMNGRALTRAPLRVLVGANMPAALVEVGFLTNAAQEKQVASDEFQASIVQALLDGILRYRAAAAGGNR
jgi:N-acetylmuramoyl-L-alanine amidase